LHGLLLDALEGISFLTDQVAGLNEENRRLRSEWTKSSSQHATLTRSLREEVAACRAEIAGLSRAAGSAGSKQAARAPSHTAAASAPGFPSLGTSAPAWILPPPVLPGDPRTGSVPTGESTRTLIKRQTRPKTVVSASVGASSSSQLSVVVAASRPRAIFVTKLAPSTTSSDMFQHLASVDAAPIRCRRLKTRYDSYASFHVAVDDATYEKLRDPSLWPKSCLYKPFRGSLRNDLLHECE
ncbi:unnamed protein product, partial [Ixodes hexagonus]